MNCVVIKVAGLSVGLNSSFSNYIEKKCSSYLMECRTPKIMVSPNRQIKNLLLEEGCGKEEAEFLSLFNVLAGCLPHYQRMVVHGACVKYKGHAILFSGNRGVGKTCLANRFVANFKEESTIINGDKTILYFTDDHIFAFGGPWCGKEGVNQNDHAPLKAIFILENKGVLLDRLSNNEAFDLLLLQTHLPVEPKSLSVTINMIEKMIKKIPIYRLGISFADLNDVINTIINMI